MAYYDPKNIFTDPVHDNKCEDLMNGCERSRLQTTASFCIAATKSHSR